LFSLFEGRRALDIHLQLCSTVPGWPGSEASPNRLKTGSGCRWPPTTSSLYQRNASIMSKHQETPLGHCLGCVPVRTGVLAFSCLLLFLSFCAVAGLVTEDTRMLVGGYTYWSNIWVDILGCLGVVFSLMCLVGVTDNHSRWVRLFAHFASFRIVAYLFIVWSDFRVLETCEKFGLSSMTDHYNPAMEMVVLQGRCPSTRTYYTMISILDIAISLYGVWNTYYWCHIVDTSPMYHISLDDSKPLRIYTGYSTVGHPEAPPIVTVVPPTMQGADEKMGFGPGGHPNMVPSFAYLAPPPPQYGGYGYGGTQPGSTAAIPY